MTGNSERPGRVERLGAIATLGLDVAADAIGSNERVQTIATRNADTGLKLALEPSDLAAAATLLERHFRDAQDVTFMREGGRLRVVDALPQRRSARAALRIAVDLVKEGIIGERDAVLSVPAEQVEKLLHPNIDPEAKRKIIAKGLAASPGAASGHVVFSAEEAALQAKAGRRVILVRVETSPEDIVGMGAAHGILTARGGITSHAAVVARGLGKSCVVGANIRMTDRQFAAGDVVVREGDMVTIDGASGEVMAGEVRTVMPEVGEEFYTLLGWADQHRRLRVRANADTLRDAEVALGFGAEGIGLCRTEHMFFGGDRMLVMRELILASDERERRAALKKLEPMQRADFVALFKLMGERPVAVRLLDPPLHEFLPSSDDDIAALAQSLGMATRSVRQRREALREANPMLGHRGSRLLVTMPEVYETQLRALFEALADVTDAGGKPRVEILFPLIMTETELALAARTTEAARRAVADARGVTVPYLLGAMIEVPRAALIAGDLAKLADFFSFGTNDLTQTTLGLSRDDAGKFLNAYLDQKLLADDPFASLDNAGVGELMRIACERGRAVKATLGLGVCGEHGSDPRSIAFFDALGLEYVSCSPYRVAVARLAAAQVKK